ncbi:DUF3572 domain-containing protein [Roseovarius salinarum]|uniref:DUF3572 domain-containing protein n=1 Tax=Roseovarius salinarum TaxID=1981892 RepID=UPI000C334E9F|nr:DUF3572 domain-containing protein [Roseovarius salinarum]
MNPSRDHAETVGLKCLAWLAGNEDLLPVFLGATGAGEADLRERAQDPEFLGSVLDFVMLDDAWVTDFCASAGLEPSAPMTARAALPGGETVHWT